MKLRNKKTGDIKELRDIMHEAFSEHNEKSLMNLEKEWEDYEEPKGFWTINILGIVEYTHGLPENEAEMMKAIGNYFETKEEAKKAVEKLKAWKRLKDKGFRFNKWTIPEEPKTPHIKLVIEAEMDVPDSPYDLDLLFGGEE